MKLVMTVSLICLFTLTGCNGERANQPDQCLRQEIFKQCMASLPRGPQSITAAGNDWDEVVKSCDSTAHYQSIRTTQTIKPECKAY